MFDSFFKWEFYIVLDPKMPGFAPNHSLCTCSANQCKYGKFKCRRIDAGSWAEGVGRTGGTKWRRGVYTIVRYCSWAEVSSCEWRGLEAFKLCLSGCFARWRLVRFYKEIQAVDRKKGRKEPLFLLLDPPAAAGSFGCSGGTGSRAQRAATAAAMLPASPVSHPQSVRSPGLQNGCSLSTSRAFQAPSHALHDCALKLKLW